MAAAVPVLEKLTFFDLEKMHKFYYNAYGHFHPDRLTAIVSPEKLTRIIAINAAYQNHPQRHIQAPIPFK